MLRCLPLFLRSSKPFFDLLIENIHHDHNITFNRSLLNCVELLIKSIILGYIRNLHCVLVVHKFDAP